ncbi:hypothetical protein [Streptomyces montanisoli]|uniref:Uncharacterized protein n=1 Tax=Streptomyces montanisoli TaxID=2798581 RepID=A0A940RWW2_9ACTN|nr:hypothetical protein [Streptomyces montanisoli]MBP0456999.1 hypothetical protein [Streptomyces montanisoli]
MYDFHESDDGPPGSPVWSVWLEHRNEDSALMVQTVEDTRHIKIMKPEDARADIALTATFVHLNMVLPLATEADRERLLRRLYGVAEEEAARFGKWPTEEWQFHDRVTETVVGHRWEFADLWTVVLPSHLGRTVILHGMGPRPEERILTAVTDTSPYGFDLDQPLRYEDLGRQRRAWPLADHVAASTHPDIVRRFGLDSEVR